MIRVNWILSIILSIILSVVATVVVNSIGFDWLRDWDWPTLKASARKSNDSISVGFVLDGVDRESARNLVLDASDEIVLRGGASLTFAGAVEDGPTTDFRDVRRKADRGGVTADIIFLVTRDPRLVQIACRNPDAVGCTVRAVDTGFLLAPRQQQSQPRLAIVFIHEMGHIFGLPHSDNFRSVMFVLPSALPLLTSQYVDATWRYQGRRAE